MINAIFANSITIVEIEKQNHKRDARKAQRKVIRTLSRLICRKLLLFQCSIHALHIASTNWLFIMREYMIKQITKVIHIYGAETPVEEKVVKLCLYCMRLQRIIARPWMNWHFGVTIVGPKQKSVYSTSFKALLK